MFELLRGYEPVADSAGTLYRPRVYSRVETDGRWSGWLVLFSTTAGRVISSGRETTQQTYDALVHWATTLSPIYLEGALNRALTLQPEAALADDLARLYLESDAPEEADLTAAAEVDESAARAAREEAASPRRRKRMTKADAKAASKAPRRASPTRK
jgi:hypothetical protein